MYRGGMSDPSEIFLTALPGLEPLLAAEARAAGFPDAQPVPGGVTVQGGWPQVMRANLDLRGAGRVLWRIGAFRAMHLAQLDKRARRFAWADWLHPDVPLRIEVTTRASRIYHQGAARQRIAGALTDSLGVTLAEDAPLTLMVRIEDDLVTLSLDTSGEGLHKRGFKQAVGKAPLRETMAALFLRAAGYDGREPVLDPMCGSGTFVIEAAELAAGLQPGRGRGFAFEHLVGFDPAALAALRRPAPDVQGPARFFGSDRDTGAVRMASDNATRAGVGALCRFAHGAVSDLARPEGAPGLVMVNPPYGARIGDRKLLFGLYGSLGKVLLERFSGWRVGLVTSDSGLARATGLPWLPPGPPVPHGGLTVRLHTTAPLP